MPKKKNAAGQQESPQVAQTMVAQTPTNASTNASTKTPPKRKNSTFYYEYIDHEGRVIYLDQYEWASGMGLSHKEVKKAQASRKREVKKGYADTKEA